MNNQELNHLTNTKEINKNYYEKQAKHTNQEYIRRVTFAQIMMLTMKKVSR